MNILLFVDDNKDETERHRSELTKENITIETSSSINRAYEKIKKKESEIKLVILDLFIPNNFSLLEHHKIRFSLGDHNQGRLLAEELKDRNIPFIYLCNDSSFYGDISNTKPDAKIFQKSPTQIDKFISEVKRILMEGP